MAKGVPDTSNRGTLARMAWEAGLLTSGSFALIGLEGGW